MAGRKPKWRRIVAAHKSGEIDLTQMTLTEVAYEFECSTHTAGLARNHLGISLRVRSGGHPFMGTEQWNDDRRDYLESWGR